MTRDRATQVGVGWICILAAMLLFAALFAGCESAADLDDRQAMTSESIVDRVWRETWGRHEPRLGPPPKVVVDEGLDPRCDARRFWTDAFGCVYGVFGKHNYTVTLGRESPKHLARELTHAAMWRYWELYGGDFLAWSEVHSPEYQRQLCRAEYWHGLAIGEEIRDQLCPDNVREQVEREEGARR